MWNKIQSCFTTAVHKVFELICNKIQSCFTTAVHNSFEIHPNKKDASRKAGVFLFMQIYYTTLLSVRRHEVQRCFETDRPPSSTLTFCTFKLQRRRVAFLDHGRLLPNCGLRAHCSHRVDIGISSKTHRVQSCIFIDLRYILMLCPKVHFSNRRKCTLGQSISIIRT